MPLKFLNPFYPATFGTYAVKILRMVELIVRSILKDVCTTQLLHIYKPHGLCTIDVILFLMLGRQTRIVRNIIYL